MTASHGFHVGHQPGHGHNRINVANIGYRYRLAGWRRHPRRSHQMPKRASHRQTLDRLSVYNTNNFVEGFDKHNYLRTVHLGDLYTESGQTLQGSCSAVSTPIFASKYSLESSRRDLQNPLRSVRCKAPKNVFGI